MRFAHFQFDAQEDKLGEGPSSEVFKAVDMELGRTVALKILRPHVEFDQSAKERFEREAKHTSNLVHPNIATVHEYGQDKGTSFIAMEFLQGRTLELILKDRNLGYEEGLRIALQVASALARVHQSGLIHRDLKPANIMVMGDGLVKLLDFGICRSNDESNITQEGMLVGTVLYMSPEQVLGEELDLRSDVFAFGSVFYHALSGCLPFPGKSFPEVCMSILDGMPSAPSKVRSGFPDLLSGFLLRCLARDKTARPAHGGALFSELSAIAENLKLSASSERPALLEGRLWIPPFQLQAPEGTASEAEAFAGGLRADLASEITRSTNLEVVLPKGQEIPTGPEGSFVVRGTLQLSAEHGVLEYHIERAHGRGQNDTDLILRERIEQSDADEWGLQAKLVGSLLRSIKRRLTEYTLAPPPEAKRDPRRAEALSKLAHETLGKGTTRHLMSAVATFRVALKDDPSCALAYAGLSEAYVRKFLFWDGDVSFLQEAREQAQLALGMDASCAEAHTSLGFASLMSGDLGDAQREFRLAIQIDHNEWLAHRLLGALLGRLGNFDGASPLLQRAIALRQEHIGSYDHLYGVMCRLDRYLEAIEVADKGIEQAKRRLKQIPDDQEARLHLAQLLARMGREDDARQMALAAKQRTPKDPYTLFHHACVLALVGDEDEAMNGLQEAQARGFYMRSECQRNSDLESLRGRPDFQALIG